MNPLRSTSAAIALCLLPKAAFAFSGGPHHAATYGGLDGVLEPSAIKMVYIANFQVDYMYQKDNAVHCWHPDHSAAYDWDCFGKDFKDAFGCTDKYCHAPGHHTQYFHFENYPTGEWIERGLIGIEKALKSIALEARDKDDPEWLLNGLGIALHTIQDMYTHSNIADRDWRAWLGSPRVTLNDVPHEAWTTKKMGLLSDRTSTGWDVPTDKVVENVWNMWSIPNRPPLEKWPKHGPGSEACKPGTPATNESCGINHDTVVRSSHLRSLMMAADATRQLAWKVRVWLKNDAFWKKVQSFDGGDWVEECNWRTRRMSNLTGEWGYPAREPINAAIFWEAITDDCSDGWQDDRWRVVIEKMYNSLMTVAKPKVAVTDPADPAVYGTYSVVVGDKVGILAFNKNPTCQATVENGGLFSGSSASLTVDGKKTELCAKGEGLKMKFVAFQPTIDLDGEVTLMSQGKKALSGFTRTAGIPNGIWGHKQ